jgi:hypothetical protein
MITAHNRRRAVAGVLALVAMASCGDDDAADDDTTIASTSASTTEGTTASSVPSSTEPATTIQTAEAILEQMPEGQVQAVGGVDCATELATVLEAGQRYVAERAAAPASLDVLYDEGYIDEPATHWFVEGNELKPVEGSGCVSLSDAQQTRDECRAAAATLRVARQAYFAQTPDAPEPTQADLVEAGLIREPYDIVDLDDGEVVATEEGPCESVDLSEGD